MKIFFYLTFFFFFIFNINTSDIFNHIPNDIFLDLKFNLPENTYHKYCKNIYSQNGEDGILEQLLKELNIENGTFCEFGAANGVYSSNTYNLIKNHNFSGIAIEPNKSLYQQCVEAYKSFLNIQVFQGSVIYNDKNYDLNAWLRKGNLPADFDVLSIDIDYDDYFVWENLTEFKPKIVIIETNSYRDPIFEELPGISSTEYNMDLLTQLDASKIANGCSFMSAVKLGLNKGYVPVSYTGNITFVRKDLIHEIREFPYVVSNDPYEYISLYSCFILWGNKWHTNKWLILNVAIGDYYLSFKKKYIDITWLKERTLQIINNLKK